MARIVVFDTETTGLYPDIHDVIQIAAICLNPDFTVDKSIAPFYMLIQPSHYQDTPAYLESIKEAMKINKLNIDDVMKKGFHPMKAAELFDEWWRALGGAKLEPLCQNYPFDSSFLKAWLGPRSYNDFFDRYYRDTYSIARFLTDQAEFSGSRLPFPEGFNLKKLATALNIPFEKQHDAWDDCIATAEVYKRMVLYTHLPKGLPKDLDELQRPYPR